MGFLQSIKSCMAKGFAFSGRASRSEFWWFVLFIAITYTVLANVFNQPTSGYSFYFGFNLHLDVSQPWWSNLYTAIFTLPFFSVLVRRSHDIGIGGDKIFATIFACFAAFTLILKLSPTANTQQLLLFTILGILALGFFYLTLSKSYFKSNQFGPNPLAHTHPNEASS